MDLQLKGMNALVVGGTRGIGRGIVQALAEEGTNVAVTYRSRREETEAFLAELEATCGVRTFAVEYDVANTERVSSMFDEVETALGPIDILVNNANGGVIAKPVSQTTPEEWRLGINGTMNYMFDTCSRFIKACEEAGRGGHIVNLSSKAVIQQNSPNKASYAAGKSAVIGLTRSIAKEVTGKGIYANAIMPGYVASDINYVEGSEQRETYKKFLPMGDFANPIDIGRLVCFLVSPINRVVIGTVTDATGGLLS